MSKMICQQITAIVEVEANHLANKYTREYNKLTQRYLVAADISIGDTRVEEYADNLIVRVSRV